MVVAHLGEVSFRRQGIVQNCALFSLFVHPFVQFCALVRAFLRWALGDRDGDGDSDDGCDHLLMNGRQFSNVGFFRHFASF